MAATKSAGNTSSDDKAPSRKPRAAATRTATDEKTPSARRPRTAKSSPLKNEMSAEERYRMVEVAAYFLAERNRFAGNPVEYWTQAEAQISSMLGE